jgi:hypothetical protein
VCNPAVPEKPTVPQWLTSSHGTQEEIIEAPEATPQNSAASSLAPDMEDDVLTPQHNAGSSAPDDGPSDVDTDQVAGDDWKHAVHDMFVLVAQQQACADRSDLFARGSWSVCCLLRASAACGDIRGLRAPLPPGTPQVSLPRHGGSRRQGTWPATRAPGSADRGTGRDAEPW